MIPALIAGMALLLAACGDKAPSNVTFEQVGAELAKGEDAFNAYLKALPNRKVNWSGTVVEVRYWNEDDYMRAAGVMVDADGKPGADAFVHLRVGDAERLKAGARVGFVAVITGIQREDGRLIVELQAETVTP